MYNTLLQCTLSTTTVPSYPPTLFPTLFPACFFLFYEHWRTWTHWICGKVEVACAWTLIVLSRLYSTSSVPGCSEQTLLVPSSIMSPKVIYPFGDTALIYYILFSNSKSSLCIFTISIACMSDSPQNPKCSLKLKHNKTKSRDIVRKSKIIHSWTQHWIIILQLWMQFGIFLSLFNHK